MKPSFAWLAWALISAVVPFAAAQTNPPTITCSYGVPAAFDEGILQYDDFTVQFRTRSELKTTEGRAPWITWTFEVLDREHRTIGGDITFNSEARANGRRFDVHGKIFVAEMFSTTADLPATQLVSTTALTRLASHEMVVWDESSAAKHNARLAPIWTKERVEPGARWSSTNAYADGVLLDGFSPPLGKFNDGASRLARGSLAVEKVSLARAATQLAPSSTFASEYGQRQFYSAGTLRYPDFFLQLVERAERHSLPGETPAIDYQFFVYDREGLPVQRGLNFSTYDLANGRAFQVGGKTYFAELFFTTASLGERSASVAHLSLREGEIIIWDETTARIGNRKIGTAWFDRDLPPGSIGIFAAGVPVQMGIFHSTIESDANKWPRTALLDHALTVQRPGQIVFPATLSGSGFIGHVSGIIFVKADGTVDHVETSDGNNPLFQDSAKKALQAWRFSSPIKNDQPVKAAVPFRWEISEPVTRTVQLQLN